MNYELIGDRVVIALDKAVEHTKTASGLEVPLFYNTESDGGRPIAKVSDRTHLPKGTVHAISSYAKSKLADLGITISEGDKVFVNPSAVSPSYQFFESRDNLVQDFEGLICISHLHIEAKILS